MKEKINRFLAAGLYYLGRGIEKNIHVRGNTRAFHFCYLQALRFDTSYKPLLIRLQYIYFQKPKQLKRAISYCQKGIDTGKESSLLYLLLGGFYSWLKGGKKSDSSI